MLNFIITVYFVYLNLNKTENAIHVKTIIMIIITFALNVLISIKSDIKTNFFDINVTNSKY